ncbi:MAG TPA: hypothetical protein VJR89_42400 [Polyangiales bacterium]|nr:hypothetical protein [Polyangiales bacterium]
MLRLLAALALLLAAVVLRTVHSARSELAAARTAAERGDTEQALAHYRRAARDYVPASPYHTAALDQLASLGRAAQAAGDLPRALSAYRAIRGSILAARSFYVPEPDRLRAADRAIAALMAEQPAPAMDAHKSKQQLRDEHLALLERSPDPNLLWTVVLLLGFFAFVGAAFAFSTFAVDDEDRLRKPEARRWGAVIVIGFGLFALGLALA